MTVAIKNIAQEFGKVWRQEFDDLPLAMNQDQVERLELKAIEYKPWRILAMWVLYINDPWERKYDPSVKKFLTDEKLNKFAIRFNEEQKKAKERAQEAERQSAKPRPLTPDEEFAQAVAYYKALCAKCSREALHEILFKTCSPPWFWDMAGLERPPEVAEKLLYKPDSRDFNCRVDAICQYLEKGYIEWGEVDNAWMKVSVLKGAGNQNPIWTGQNLGKGFWCPSLGMTVRIDIGELPEEAFDDSTCGLMDENDDIDFF